jgi:hypothetical protein
MKPMEVIPLSAIMISGASTTGSDSSHPSRQSPSDIPREDNQPGQIHGKDEPVGERDQ